MARISIAVTISLGLAASLLAACAPLQGLVAGTQVSAAGDAASSRAVAPNSVNMGGGFGGVETADAKGTVGFAPTTDGANGTQGSGLKGGELDDNSTFDKYLEYLASYRASNVARVDVSQRYILQVVDEDGKGVPNATVSVKVGSEPVFSALSTSNGRVLFFPKAFPHAATGDFTVEAAKGALTQTATLSYEASGSVTLALGGKRGTIPRRVDLGFVLDVTGSMGDELGQIQTSVNDISARIKSLPGDPSVRYGLVAYRDQRDDFVTRTHDFTDDLPTFKSRLNSLAAAAGGDYPEDVNEGVHQGVSGLSWDSGETLRLMFVVGDAPPHMDYGQQNDYAASMKKAARGGIKIFPIAASGLDNQGEYVFRQMAQFTGGKFLFITYGGDTPHHVGPVQENNLDDLVVGIVKGELANLD